MSDDLIKRMREGVTWDDAVAAIDRIEQSEREQDECFELSVHWRKEADFLAEQRREAQAKLAKALEALRWAYDTLKEINTRNYTHDDVCNLNDASVNVIIGIGIVLAELEGEPLGAEFEAVWDANKAELYQP